MKEGLVIFALVSHACILCAFVAFVSASQDTDSIPDKLRADILTADRAMTIAERQKDDAMKAYHQAESKFEAAMHNRTALLQQANALCGPKAVFDLDAGKCRPIPGR